MDAIQFIKEKERMCKACGSCILCPAAMGDGCVVGLRSGVAPEQQIKIVKEWTEQHPRKTRQDVFLEQYPEASVGYDGVLDVCPAPIDAKYRSTKGGCVDIHRSCRYCLREYWSQEVE